MCTNSYLHAVVFVILLCHFGFLTAVFVWHHCNGRRKRLAVKFSNFTRLSPAAKNRSDTVQYENLLCNMTINHKKRILWFYNTVWNCKCNNIWYFLVEMVFSSHHWLYLQWDIALGNPFPPIKSKILFLSFFGTLIWDEVLYLIFFLLLRKLGISNCFGDLIVLH